MTDKLSPKPDQKENLMNWQDLDAILQSVFSEADKNGQKRAVIRTSEFSMSKEEIVFEAEKNKYKVTESGDGVLLIE